VKLRPASAPNPNWPQGDYALIYATPQASGTFGSVINVANGKMVNRWSGCGTTPEGIISTLDVESFVLPPR
jgi:hypothetical protein